jgi:hypothetical protein
VTNKTQASPYEAGEASKSKFLFGCEPFKGSRRRRRTAGVTSFGRDFAWRLSLRGQRVFYSPLNYLKGVHELARRSVGSFFAINLGGADLTSGSE